MNLLVHIWYLILIQTNICACLSMLSWSYNYGRSTIFFCVIVHFWLQSSYQTQVESVLPEVLTTFACLFYKENNGTNYSTFVWRWGRLREWRDSGDWQCESLLRRYRGSNAYWSNMLNYTLFWGNQCYHRRGNCYREKCCLANLAREACCQPEIVDAAPSKFTGVVVLPAQRRYIAEPWHKQAAVVWCIS